MRYYWRIWAKAIGEKVGKNDRESDLIAMIRTSLVIFMLATNVVIMVSVWRHW